MKTSGCECCAKQGGRVRENVLLRDSGIPGIDLLDGRKIEIVVTGLPLAYGIPVAIDANSVSLLHANGLPHRNADVAPGSSFIRAERLKETIYPELVDSSLLRLETVACEVGGRFSHRAQTLLDVVVVAKVRSDVSSRQKVMAKWWRNRWLTMLAVGVQTSLSSTLINDGCSILDGHDGPFPSPKIWESRDPCLDYREEVAEDPSHDFSHVFQVDAPALPLG